MSSSYISFYNTSTPLSSLSKPIYYPTLLFNIMSYQGVHEQGEDFFFLSLSCQGLPLDFHLVVGFCEFLLICFDISTDICYLGNHSAEILWVQLHLMSRRHYCIVDILILSLCLWSSSWSLFLIFFQAMGVGVLL